jgi:IS1 family transposase
MSLAGKRCQRLCSKRIRNIPVRDVQCDEIWGFVAKKEAHKWFWEAHDDKIGDAYCFIAIERNTKLVLTWHLGRRDRIATEDFISKLRTATADSQFQITTDGFPPYVAAIDSGLSDRVDFAVLVKRYAAAREGEQWYSPADVVDAVPQVMLGNPDRSLICTSHIERQNLTIRMSMRRMTRLTNAFSKQWENLKAAYAVHFAYCNFCRIHRTLRITPAMAAGITDHPWKIEELLTAA